MLTIEVNRKPTTENGTLGNLRVLLDGAEVYKCYTLEDPVREKKAWGDSAIPAGTYRVAVRFSNRFKKDLPGIEAVAATFLKVKEPILTLGSRYLGQWYSIPL